MPAPANRSSKYRMNGRPPTEARTFGQSGTADRKRVPNPPASIAADTRNTSGFQTAMAVTCAFGLGFLVLEGQEFASLVARGAGPTRSAFLSSFFTLVGCHGLHVSAGILWLLTMMAQVFTKGFRPDIQRRILCFALFWHALDIIWVAIFSVVYLIGSAA